MVKVVYIGNYLQNPLTNPPYMLTLGSMLEQGGIEVRYASSKKNKVLRMLDMLYTVWKNRSWATQVLIDTYSTQNFYYAYLIGKLCRILKMAYIPILHGGDLPQRLEKSKTKSKNLFSGASFLVSPSHYMKKRFEDKGYTRLRYIPNAIDIDSITFHQKAFDELKLIWVRSFKEIYNPKLALEVLSLLKESGVPAKLCMVGPDSGGILPELKNYTAENKLDVEFTGKLSKADWFLKSRDFNIMINTTNFDNMPLSIVEAMALGLAVVSTDVGGLPYLIERGKTGLLVEANSAKAFKDALMQCIDSEEDTIKRTLNARSFAERFDAKIIQNQWIELLNRSPKDS